MRFNNLPILLTLSCTSLISAAMSQASPSPVAPDLTFLYSMDALLGERFSLGRVPTGQERIVIPIVGGTFEGPKLRGTILNLGADWRLTDAGGILRPDARYGIRTDDGADIYVQTEGYPLSDGRTMLRGRFETGLYGKYAWLNDVLGVGVLRRNGTSGVRIEMWHATPGSA